MNAICHRLFAPAPGKKVYQSMVLLIISRAVLDSSRAGQFGHADRAEDRAGASHAASSAPLGKVVNTIDTFWA
jgi:hypothetical protein